MRGFTESRFMLGGTCATAQRFEVMDVTDQNISISLASVVGYAFLAATELIASI